MKFKTIFLSLLITVPALLLTGCKQEGPQGPAGLDGNANVIASQWITPTAWQGKPGDWFFDISNSSITKDIVESGAILAYVSLPGDVSNLAVRPLPAYIIGANWDFLLPNDGQSSYGTIEFTTDMATLPGITGYNFRFILIPSNISLKSASLNTPGMSDLRKMSYKEVCKLFGIQE
jgi:hypothetical protein